MASNNNGMRRPNTLEYHPLMCSIAIYDETFVWNHIEKYFLSHLPLKNPSWRE